MVANNGAGPAPYSADFTEITALEYRFDDPVADVIGLELRVAGRIKPTSRGGRRQLIAVHSSDEPDTLRPFGDPPRALAAVVAAYEQLELWERGTLIDTVPVDYSAPFRFAARISEAGERQIAVAGGETTGSHLEVAADSEIAGVTIGGPAGPLDPPSCYEGVQPLRLDHVHAIAEIRPTPADLLKPLDLGLSLSLSPECRAELLRAWTDAVDHWRSVWHDQLGAGVSPSDLNGARTAARNYLATVASPSDVASALPVAPVQAFGPLPALSLSEPCQAELLALIDRELTGEQGTQLATALAEVLGLADAYRGGVHDAD